MPDLARSASQLVTFNSPSVVHATVEGLDAQVYQVMARTTEKKGKEDYYGVI